MANSYFTIPDTGTIIYNGDTVILAEYPGVMAVAAYGWYKQGQSSEMGWHFVLLPTNEAISVADVNLSLVTVVSNSSGNHRPDCRPCPPPPGPSQMEQRTFITLDSMAQLKNMKTMFMPNGRIVRVNNKGDGKPGYYEWNIISQEWDVWDISQISPGPTPIPEGVIQLKELDVVNSVDSVQFTDPYIRYSFKAGKPLCDNIGVAENSACELYYSEIYQVIRVVASQDAFIRTVYQVSPSWTSGEWVESSDQTRLNSLEATVEILQTELSTIQTSIVEIQSSIVEIQSTIVSHAQRIVDLESAIDTIKQNDQLENVLNGYPRLSDEELNEILESRLNGEGIDL